MKTITQIKKHFSNEEIKILIEIIRGRQDFDVMETAIKDFYSDDYNTLDMDNDKIQEQVRDELLEKLEFDFEMGGVI
jgi:tmRNA-binding protein